MTTYTFQLTDDVEVTYQVISRDGDGRRNVVGTIMVGGGSPMKWDGLGVPAGMNIPLTIVQWLSHAASASDDGEGPYFSVEIDEWACEHEDDILDYLIDNDPEYADAE